jgi:deazaflavin-dependent oxidoreductase (nitroreductase family)
MGTRLGRRTAHFNRRVTNRLTRPLARRLPGFGVVVHRGRKSGRRFETPVNVFNAQGGYLIALTYGTESDWVKNVLATGGCELITRGRRRQLPHLNSSTTKHSAPFLASCVRSCASCA